MDHSIYPTGSGELVGIDLAAQPATTALARGVWDGSRLQLGTLVPAHIDDDQILAALRPPVEVAALDVPFGWPAAFAALVGRYLPGAPAPRFTAAQRDRLRFRQTDLMVRDITGRWPLSVAADRIALPALRAAGLLAALPCEAAILPSRPRGHPLVIECYPVATLAVLARAAGSPGLATTGYKTRRTGREEARRRRLGIVQLLDGRWVEATAEQWALCLRVDHALDAVLCALTAGLHLAGRTLPPPPSPEVEREGWIVVPDLVNAGDSSAPPHPESGADS